MTLFFPMGMDAQHGKGNAQARSGWSRLLACVFLLLLAVMSTAQVCHTHADLVTKQGSRQGDTTPEDHCPLCVAMHTALPASIQVAPELLGSVRVLDSVAADAERMFRWRFAMASRPPPAGVHFA